MEKRLNHELPAESTSPEAVREHNLVAVTLSVAFRERATECHRDPEQFEVIPRDLRALGAFRIAEPSHIDRDGHHGGCAGKGFTRTVDVPNVHVFKVPMEV